MASFVILPCAGCEVGTTLPSQSLGDITQHQNPPVRGKEFANFVCPHCGLGTRHLVTELEVRKAISFSILSPPPLYCARLRCGDMRCEERALVHTTARGAERNAEPTKDLNDWKVDALQCPCGHQARVPMEKMTHHVFAR